VYGGGIVPPMVSAGSLDGPPQVATADRVEVRPIADPGGAPVLIGFLVTFQNEPTGKFWPLRSGRTSLGRGGVDNEADVALPDASASARHAFIQGDPNTGQAFVEDAGSRNGTFINEQKIDKGLQRQLHDNDRLRLGSITLVVKLLASG
jgi:pSer/pThr/pTyr-binding forkhead associated (FHA) protein